MHVKGKKWDKNRQKLFCEYLGFSDTNDLIIESNRPHEGNDIVTGDFIFYKTQLGKISFCVHLKPRAKDSKRSKLSYAKCKYLYRYVCVCSQISIIFRLILCFESRFSLFVRFNFGSCMLVYFNNI